MSNHPPRLQAAHAYYEEYIEALKEYDQERIDGYKIVDEDCEHLRTSALEVYLMYVLTRDRAERKFNEENDARTQ